MDQLASADVAQLSYIKETAYGVTPAEGKARNLRMQSESLKFNRTKQADKELAADGQPTASTTVGAQADGDVKVHMQYAEYDDFLAAVVRSAWSVFGVNGVGAAFSGTFTANTITAGAATSGASIFTNLQKGQWFRLDAPGNGNDGAWLRASTTVAATATVITLDAATPLTPAAGVANCKIATSRVANTKLLTTFTLQKAFTDVEKVFAFAGMGVSKFSTSFNDGATTDASFTFLGKGPAKGQTGTIFDESQLPETIAESHTYEIHNGVVGVGNLWEGGAPTDIEIKTISLDVDSALRAQTALKNLGPIGLGMGTIAVKGKITLYFKDGDLYEKYENDVYTSLVFSTKDDAGNGYVFTLPKAQLSNASIVAGGKNTDVMAEFDFECFADRANPVPALRKTIIIDRLGAAVPA